MLTVPCLEVAPSEREQLMSAFRAHPGLEALLLSGLLSDHLSMLRYTRVMTVATESRVDVATLERMPRLEMLATRSAAATHIDLEGCRRRGVIVTNVPSGSAIADTTVAAVADWSEGREPANRVA